GVLPEQDVFAHFHVQRDDFPLFRLLAVSDGKHFRLLRLLFRRVGDDDAAFDGLFLFYSLHQNAILKRSYSHSGVSFQVRFCPAVAGQVSGPLTVPNSPHDCRTALSQKLFGDSFGASIHSVESEIVISPRQLRYPSHLEFVKSLFSTRSLGVLIRCWKDGEQKATGTIERVSRSKQEP